MTDDERANGHAAGQAAGRGGVPIAEAARVLGIAPEAVRKRVRRGTIRAHKVDGQWYVVLPERDAPPDNRPATGQDHYRELVDALRDEVSWLRQELAVRTAELERKDHIIAALTQRLPELPPPAEPRKPDDDGRPWWRRILG